MLAFVLCFISFAICFLAARRRLWAGFVATMAVGYLYGIVRANVQSPLGQFIYDAAVAGLLLGISTRQLSAYRRSRVRRLIPWMICLIGWPTLLMLVPAQDLLIQLVGWRANVLFVPFVLIGAMMSDHDLRLVARSLGAMNIAVFAVALVEIVYGVPLFYPYNPQDSIIYHSTDVYFANQGHFRIPGTFTQSATYATTMVASLPLLLGALDIEPKGSLSRLLLFIGSATSGLAVFLAASRSEAVILLGMISVTVFRRYRGNFPRMGWLGVILGSALLVVSTPRMQRFFTLGDTSLVAERLHGSINDSFGALVWNYPFGNGLGSGGTSVPYFLQGRITEEIGIENEFGRIVAELGVPGLLLWSTFMLLVVLQRQPPRSHAWHFGKSLARLFCVTSFIGAPIGTGMLNAIPQTALLLTFCGWLLTPEPRGSGNVQIAVGA